METTRHIAAFFGLLAVLAASPGEGNEGFVGDLCKRKDGSIGVCRSVNDCAEGREELKKGQTPTICSYDNFVPILCCPRKDKAGRMCNQYGEAVYEKVPSPVLTQLEYDTNNLCAVTGVPFVVGGEDASPNEFPHMALIGYGNDSKKKIWGCGGTLISNRYIMTAAHCINSNDGQARWVRLGELDIGNEKEPVNKHVDYMVTETIPHPDWKGGIYYDDIALLKLDREVQFTASIRPACLHPIKEISDKEAIASGWGFTHWAVQEISNKLMKVKLPIQKTEECQKAYRTLIATSNRLADGIREDSMVCAGNLTGGTDTCKGDSGGPLQVKLGNPYCMYSIIGVTSFGKTVCGSPNSPAVYTRVSHFLPWIESIVWPDVN